jgi:hypothetical protein
MRTDDLIAALAADNAEQPTPLARAFTVDGLVGWAVTALPFFWLLGPRHNFVASLGDPRFLFKFLFTAVMALSGLALVWRLARPNGVSGWAGKAVLLGPALALAACIVEMILVPENQWGARLVGENPWHCLIMVPMMAIAPGVGLFLALKHAAPGDPRRAGAAAAFAAAGLAAFLYAMNCPDDSPFYVGVWYLLATSFVVALGWFAGGRLLRW